MFSASANGFSVRLLSRVAFSYYCSALKESILDYRVVTISVNSTLSSDVTDLVDLADSIFDRTLVFEIKLNW